VSGPDDADAGTELPPLDRATVVLLAGGPGADLTCCCVQDDGCGCAGLESLERCPCWERWARTPGVLVFHHPDSAGAREHATLAELADDLAEDHCVPVRVPTRSGHTVVRVAGAGEISEHGRAALGQLVDVVAGQMDQVRARETTCGQVMPPSARRAACRLAAQHETHNPVCDNGYARWSPLRPEPGPLSPHRRMLHRTVVRVIASGDGWPRHCDDPATTHAWVVISAWQTSRAVLVDAGPLLRAADVDDVESLLGVRFLADVLEPLGLAEPQEEVRLDNVRVAGAPPVEWMPVRWPVPPVD
jgi:hypothetical protein